MSRLLIYRYKNDAARRPSSTPRHSISRLPAFPLVNIPLAYWAFPASFRVSYRFQRSLVSSPGSNPLQPSTAGAGLSRAPQRRRRAKYQQNATHQTFRAQRWNSGL